MDELPDFQGLSMWLTVNGQSRQKSATANMILDVPHLVSYVSQSDESGQLGDRASAG